MQLVDGDRLLVIADKRFIEIAKRNMIGVNSLYYPMKKAKKGLINPEALYNGLELAFTGGRIGGISNNITKIWASNEVNEDAIKCVKWLCMETNFVIDHWSLHVAIRVEKVGELRNLRCSVCV